MNPDDPTSYDDGSVQTPEQAAIIAASSPPYGDPGIGGVAQDTEDPTDPYMLSTAVDPSGGGYGAGTGVSGVGAGISGSDQQSATQPAADTSLGGAVTGFFTGLLSDLGNVIKGKTQQSQIQQMRANGYAPLAVKSGGTSFVNQNMLLLLVAVVLIFKFVK